MKEILYDLFDCKFLSREQARNILTRIAGGEFNENQIASFITVFLMRSISIDELIGFRQALLDMRTVVDLSDYDAIDIVGTGGDNKNTFNISTASCFVVAGAGYKVVKHGNYGATSVSGASNVIECHGVKFTRDPYRLRESMDKCGIAYLHAPLFNPALKAVAPVRKALGVRTFFNVLGPLVNPVLPKYQMLGVYDLKMERLYNYLYQQMDMKGYSVVHSLDGYDEISLTSDFKFCSGDKEKIYSPEELGFPMVCEKELYGGDFPEKASVIFDDILYNRTTESRKNVIIANAGFAIRTINPSMNIEDCIGRARESIESGNAARVLEKFISLNS
ncbi:MAG: anthranilate phosphoribosyltransferase [Bacteroidales bacterium]|nr:anthranilate phosphoribosyltransferase [Bacteroidales bacterium]